MASSGKQKNNLVFVIYSDNMTTIYNSSLVRNASKMIDTIIKYRLDNNLLITRTRGSYIRELKSHNRMYKLGMFKNHTRDTDLEENIKLWKEIAYFIIGI